MNRRVPMRYALANFPFLGTSNRNIQYVLQSNQLDRILQEYRETVLDRQLHSSRREYRFL